MRTRTGRDRLMLALAVIATLLHVLVNAFGAWAVQNRRRWLAGMFLLASATLMTAAVALVFATTAALPILALGLLLATSASYLNARYVMARVIWQNHVLRLVVAGMLFLLALLALRN